MRRGKHGGRLDGAECGVFRVLDPAVARLARRQHGLVTRRQLLAMGARQSSIDRRLATGELRRVRRSIYLVGPITPPLARELAAVLACGESAVLSHDHAAALHRLRPPPRGAEPVHVTVAGHDPGRKPGVVVHRVTALRDDERTRRERIPVTTAARTILDLAPSLRRPALEQLVAEGFRKGIDLLPLLLARYPHRPGTPALRALVDRPIAPKFTRSSSERRLLELIRRAGLPEPETNAQLGGYEVDFLWRELRLIIEVDSQPFHASLPDRRRDHRRDAELAAGGHTVLRIDGDEIMRRPEAAVAFVARAVAQLSGGT